LRDLHVCVRRADELSSIYRMAIDEELEEGGE